MSCSSRRPVLLEPYASSSSDELERESSVDFLDVARVSLAGFLGAALPMRVDAVLLPVDRVVLVVLVVLVLGVLPDPAVVVLVTVLVVVVLLPELMEGSLLLPVVALVFLVPVVGVSGREELIRVSFSSVLSSSSSSSSSGAMSRRDAESSSSIEGMASSIISTGSNTLAIVVIMPSFALMSGMRTLASLICILPSLDARRDTAMVSPDAVFKPFTVSSPRYLSTPTGLSTMCPLMMVPSLNLSASISSLTLGSRFSQAWLTGMKTVKPVELPLAADVLVLRNESRPASSTRL
mmetsp:Transcript_49132/g.123156  ORF Transcript_49132/g.123156 Transcript_49132/m.123156 type:complete len:293 (-) Transcript_49132:1272-2150(-)